MKIHDDHLYHGAALTQIAEHPSFKAINADSEHGIPSRSIFLINDNIGLFIKYASKTQGKFKEFMFTFHANHLEELEKLNEKRKKVFITLICVSAREICCISYKEFLSFLTVRAKEKGHAEDSYTILVTIPKGKQARVYINAPGVKKTMIGERKVPRNEFPNCIFTK